MLTTPHTDDPSATPTDPEGRGAGAWTDPGASARARRASEARHRSTRRPGIDPTTCERDYTAEELEFMRAMQDYKLRSGRLFPTWSEVLEVLCGLGYRKPPKPTTETEHQASNAVVSTMSPAR